MTRHLDKQPAILDSIVGVQTMNIERELRKGLIRSCEDCGELFRPFDPGDPDEVCHVCLQFIEHAARLAPAVYVLWGEEQFHND